jgi:hypothetical protein
LEYSINNGDGLMKRKILKTLTLLLVLIMCTFSGFTINATETDKSIAKINVTYDYIPKNGSDDHLLVSGSDMGLVAKVYYNDGTVAKGDYGKVSWSISSTKDSLNDVYKSEYTNKENFSCLKLYAPYNYINTLTITATSQADNKISGVYELKIDTDIYENRDSYFEFNANEPKGTTSTGKETEFTENWDGSKGTYSVIIPENTYKIKGYSFECWKDENGKKYYPGDTLTISVSENSGTYYPLYAEWKTTNESVTTQPTENLTNSESTADEANSNLTSPNTGDYSMLYILLAFLFAGLFTALSIYKLKKKNK